jgi:uncharacterized protein YbaR (Trm112 family)
MGLNSELLEVLACPKCKQTVELSPDSLSVVCLGCKLRFEVKNGIPIMLFDEAVPLEEESKK